MKRSVNIILIFTVLAQTVGCGTQRHFFRVSQYPAHSEQARIRLEIQRKFREWSDVTIVVRESARNRFKEKVIECTIEKIGTEMLTVIPRKEYFGGESRRLAVRYSDIAGIEYRSTDPLLVAGCVLTSWVILLIYGVSQIELD